MKRAISTPAPQSWLMLVYKVPRQPSANRVYVWRKLRQLGAVLLQDAVWVLPANPRTQEHFQWLAAEVVELGGEASVWQSNIICGGDDGALVRQFQDQVDAAYQEILRALRRKSPDLPGLAKQFQQTQANDYFQTALGKRVRAALLSARGG